MIKNLLILSIFFSAFGVHQSYGHDGGCYDDETGDLINDIVEIPGKVGFETAAKKCCEACPPGKKCIFYSHDVSKSKKCKPKPLELPKVEPKTEPSPSQGSSECIWTPPPGEPDYKVLLDITDTGMTGHCYGVVTCKEPGKNPVKKMAGCCALSARTCPSATACVNSKINPLMGGVCPPLEDDTSANTH